MPPRIRASYKGPKVAETPDRLHAQQEKGEAFVGEDIKYRKDGTEFIFSFIDPLRDAKGEISYWVAVRRDVTERNELQAQLKHAHRLERIELLKGGALNTGARTDVGIKH